MHYSLEATEKYQREYRRYQIKQVAYLYVVGTGALAVLGLSIWAASRGDAWQQQDIAGATPHQGIFTVLTSSTSVSKYGGLSCSVVFANVQGHNAEFYARGEKVPIKFFTPGTKAWVSYRVSRSGNVYIDDTKPLP